jgi:4-hydroxybenzoate polyprenyltransferase
VNGKLLAYAQLMRLPNVFTAFADILLAACAAGYAAEHPLTLAALLVSSGCLYLGGMVLNDYFDRHDDAKTRPFRPIPSGRIPARTALSLGLVLLVVGVLFAHSAFQPYKSEQWKVHAYPPGLVALVLAGMILAYDSILKHTPLGPVAMGACRFLNVQLGLSVGDVDVSPLSVHLATVTGVYIVGVTWFARTEEGESNRRQLVLAAVVMLAALGLAVTVPAHRPPGTTPIYFPYLVAAFGFFVAAKVVPAIQRPGPKEVQAAVKRSILGLVVLDAVLATAFVGGWGLLILLLFLPARWLGKRVYST